VQSLNAFSLYRLGEDNLEWYERLHQGTVDWCQCMDPGSSPNRWENEEMHVDFQKRSGLEAPPKERLLQWKQFKMMAVFWAVAECRVATVPLIALMMEAVRTSETSVNSYQSTWRYNPEDRHLHTHRREDLRSYWNKLFGTGNKKNKLRTIRLSNRDKECEFVVTTLAEHNTILPVNDLQRFENHVRHCRNAWRTA
jgi:hypothetical protein